MSSGSPCRQELLPRHEVPGDRRGGSWRNVQNDYFWRKPGFELTAGRTTAPEGKRTWSGWGGNDRYFRYTALIGSWTQSGPSHFARDISVLLNCLPKAKTSPNGPSRSSRPHDLAARRRNAVFQRIGEVIVITSHSSTTFASSLRFRMDSLERLRGELAKNNVFDGFLGISYRQGPS